MGITIDHSWVKYVAKCTENCIAQQFFMSNLLSESIQNCKFWYQVYFNKCKHSARSNVSDFEILWFPLILMWNYNEGKDVPHIFQENQTHRCLSWNYRYIKNYIQITYFNKNFVAILKKYGLWWSWFHKKTKQTKTWAEPVSTLVPHEKSIGFYGFCDEQSISFDIKNLLGVSTSDCPCEGNN